MRPPVRLSARLWTALIVALAVLAALAGTALGARGAAESVAVESVPLPAAEGEPAAPAAKPARPGLQTLAGRVVNVRGDLVRIRTPHSDGPTFVKILPRTVIKRAGERVEPSALQRGDGVVVVGKADSQGVVLAWGIRARPLPVRPAAATPTRAASGAQPAASEAGPALRREAAPPTPPE